MMFAFESCSQQVRRRIPAQRRSLISRCRALGVRLTNQRLAVLMLFRRTGPSPRQTRCTQRSEKPCAQNAVSVCGVCIIEQVGLIARTFAALSINGRRILRFCFAPAPEAISGSAATLAVPLIRPEEDFLCSGHLPGVRPAGRNRVRRGAL